jgi:hypothetical protein
MMGEETGQPGQAAGLEVPRKKTSRSAHLRQFVLDVAWVICRDKMIIAKQPLIDP